MFSQGLIICQVKLSNGLMVHGPQCQSENDAKENAAFIALQRLVHTHTNTYTHTLECEKVFVHISQRNAFH